VTAEDAEEFHAPAKDPWKALRGVMAGVLILEVIVVLLGLPVVAKIGGGLSWLSISYICGLALLMIVASGLQRRPWALALNLGLQVAFILGFFAHPAIGWLGVLFAGVWGYILYLRRDVQLRLKEGLLPGQRD